MTQLRPLRNPSRYYLTEENESKSNAGDKNQDGGDEEEEGEEEGEPNFEQRGAKVARVCLPGRP